jgi:hypothetical protein
MKLNASSVQANTRAALAPARTVQRQRYHASGQRINLFGKILTIQNAPTTAAAFISHRRHRSPQLQLLQQRRSFYAPSCPRLSPPPPPPRPVHRDRGPPSQETTQTNFAKLDVLAGVQAPATEVDSCLANGFVLGNGLKITDGSGCFLINGEVVKWRPWEAARRPQQQQQAAASTATAGARGGAEGGVLLNDKGQWDCDNSAWGVLSLVWPKPGITALPSSHLFSPLRRFLRLIVGEEKNFAKKWTIKCPAFLFFLFL